ncbi:hypothetical protein JTB14_019527 [Gonioctena quinquepunctata]|nr:hypothetical protein JTB14_019527 [Gonioctena quinquepunctata]
MDRRIPLTDKELADIWENWSDSEDGLDFSDTGSVADPNYTPSEADISDSLVDQDEDIQEALSEESSNEVEEEVEPEDQNQLSVNNLSGKKKKLQKRKVVWKHRGIHLNDLQLAFHGDTDLPSAVMALETPYSFFSYFFSMTISLKVLWNRLIYLLPKQIRIIQNFYCN